MDWWELEALVVMEKSLIENVIRVCLTIDNSRTIKGGINTKAIVNQTKSNNHILWILEILCMTTHDNTTNAVYEMAIKIFIIWYFY